MGWLKTLVVSGSALAGIVTSAQAADMPRTLPPPYVLPRQEPAPPVIDLRSGWYLRGDFGYGVAHIDSAESTPGFPSPATNSPGHAFTGGLGVGIKTRWLRTDVTVDYLGPLKYEGTMATPPGGDASAKFSAWTALFNGYFDLGTWYRATPYIGAGAGAARLSVSEYESLAAPPFTTGLTNSQWNFAWAVMAGVGFAVSPNIIVDAGYRYLNLGDVKTAADATGYLTFKNLAAHEVRVGIRWSFDDLPVSR